MIYILWVDKIEYRRIKEQSKVIAAGKTARARAQQS
jgi:hypothetical protein